MLVHIMMLWRNGKQHIGPLEVLVIFSVKTFLKKTEMLLNMELHNFKILDILWTDLKV